MRTMSVVAAVVLGLVVAACGDSVPTPASASPVPSREVTGPSPSPDASPPGATSNPGPSPAAVDVANAFIAKVTASGFAATVELEGATTVGSATSTSVGTLVISGRDSRLTQTTTAGTTQTTTGRIIASSIRYAATNGLWFATGTPGPTDLAAVIRSIDAGVTDIRLEPKNGQALHHLSVTPPAALAASLGLVGDAFTTVSTTADVWAEEDGTPVFAEFVATYSQAVKGKAVTASKTLALRFMDVGTATTISAPSPVWKWNISSRYRYRMAYPVDWQFEKGTKKYADGYYGFDGTELFASRNKNGGFSLNQISAGLTRYLPQITGIKSLKITSNRPGRLGAMKARKIEFNYTLKGKHYWTISYLAVKGAYFYLTSYETTKKTTKADRGMAALFARSFSAR
ncbi:MAG: hypothetical protein ABIR11_06920 [Candidatus Limnocylindrales bacterium]